LRVNSDVEDFLVDMELSERKAKTINDYFHLLNKFFRQIEKGSAEQVTLMIYANFC